MRVLLIQPPVQDFYQTGIRTFPLGLACLAAVLREGGIEVAILNAHDPARRQSIPLPTRFGYIRRYYASSNKSPWRLFDHYYHFGLTLPEISDHIRRWKPELVGVASLFTAYSETALEVAGLVKKINPAIFTVMGGAHVWSMPEHVLKSGVVDFIIRGEAEFSLLALCRELAGPTPDPARLAEIAGIGFKQGSGLYLHPQFAVLQDLDALPWPARGLLDQQQYKVGERISTMLLTSRGCPFSCGFCALSASPCATYRQRQPAAVLEEIAYCHSRFGVSHFDIEDDNFTADQDHAMAILNGVRAMQDPDIRLSAMNGISACNLTPELLSAMRATGFTHLDLALVSSAVPQRQALARPGGLAQFDRILEEAGGKGLRTMVHIILGLPEDTIENMLQAIIRLLAAPCLIGANIYYPVPGSTLFGRHPAHIEHQEPACWRSTLASCESYPGQRDEYMTLFYLTRLVNYAKHLLAGLQPQPAGPAPLFRDFIHARATTAIAPEDRGQLLAPRLKRKKRLTGEGLGLFMLARFAKKRQIEKVTIAKEGDGVTYVFSEEFCQPQLVEEFWRRAAATEIRAPGQVPASSLQA